MSQPSSHHSASIPPDIAVVGFGSAGRAFTLALQQTGHTISCVCELLDSTGASNARADGFPVCDLSSLSPVQPLLVIATPDQSIESVAARVAENPLARIDGAESPRVALHLSGAHGLSPLKPLAQLGWQTAAFHPIQTFPPGSDASRFNGIHAGITADDGALPAMMELARRLGVQPMIVPDADRARYHLASVIVSNFLPLLLDVGVGCLDGIAADRDTAIQALLPLMRGMLDSLHQHDPAQAITGPVARHDLETVATHLETDVDAETKALYRQLTVALVTLAEREGRLTSEQAEEWRGKGQL
ncbi:DUF2520 domain-containing protein [bacterium]|nr:DUF2520 domain-containing protein [bacterium]